MFALCGEEDGFEKEVVIKPPSIYVALSEFILPWSRSVLHVHSVLSSPVSISGPGPVVSFLVSVVTPLLYRKRANRAIRKVPAPAETGRVAAAPVDGVGEAVLLEEAFAEELAALPVEDALAVPEMVVKVGWEEVVVPLVAGVEELLAQRRR